MPKLQKYRTINILSMIFVCILVITILYLPQQRGIGLKAREIINLRSVVERLTQIDNNPSEFMDKKNRIISDLGKINDKIPSQAMIPQVIEFVTKPIKELGLSLIAITPGEPVKRGGRVETSGGMPEMGREEAAPKEEGYMETPIELTLQGTYRQFGEYLDRLRHLPRLGVINSFDIKKNSEIAPKLDIKLKISVFHYGKE